MAAVTTRFDHVAIAVSDAAAASAFLRDVLGFDELTRRDLRDRGAAWFERHLPLPEGVSAEELSIWRSGDLVLECIQYAATEDAPAEGARAALSHLAFVVPDLDAAVATLRSAGLALAEPFPGTGTARSWVMLEAPWGPRVELVSRPYDLGGRDAPEADG